MPKPAKQPDAPRKIVLKRRLTQKQSDRLMKLMECCSTFETKGKLEIFAGSKTHGGEPLENLISEISMLLRGFEPRQKCPDVI